MFRNLHDVSITAEHIRQRLENVEYHSPNDDRLDYIDIELPEYLQEYKNKAGPEGFLSDESFNALI